MVDYKIGYILPDKSKISDNDIYQYDCYRNTYNAYEDLLNNHLNFIEYINSVNNKLELNFNIIIIEDYTIEECDLVIYSQSNLIYDKIYNRSAFENAKGNPKFLMYFNGESHTYPYWFCDNNFVKYDNLLLKTLTNYVPFCSKYKCYAISMYEDTLHNCCMPYCIDTWSLFNIWWDNYKIVRNNRQLIKDKFCAMTFFHGTREREQIYQELNKYKQIDCYGPFHKNMNDEEYYKNEILDNILPHYKFNICFENTHSDYNETYVTEKICNAFKYGSIPIYWGNNKQIYEIFNKESFINLTDIPHNKWIDIIKEYDNDDNLYNKMLNEIPLIDNDIHSKYFNKKEQFIKKILTEKY